MGAKKLVRLKQKSCSSMRVSAGVHALALRPSSQIILSFLYYYRSKPLTAVNFFTNGSFRCFIPRFCLDRELHTQGHGRMSLVSFNGPITPVKSHSKTSSQYTLVPLLEPTNMVAEGNQAASVHDRELLPYQHELSDNPRRNNGPLIQRYIHWLSPTVMVASLIAGVCFAIGHHCYYTWLDGRVVGNVGRQQWASVAN